MIKGIIFDADYTLYFPRSQEAYMEKFAYLARETGIDADRIRKEWSSIVKDVLENGVRNCRKRSREYSITKALELLGVKEERAGKLARDAINIFLKRLIKELDYDPGIRDVIKKLAADYSLCVASDEFREILEIKLNRVFGDWKRYFNFLVTAEDTEELKPSRKFCEIPLRRFGLEPDQAAFVGDSWERELFVAKSLGLKTVLVGNERVGNPDYWLKSLGDMNSDIFRLG